MLWTSIIGSRKVKCVMASDKKEDLVAVEKLIEAGKIKSIIDRSFPLGQAAEAHRYIEKGLKKGQIVLTMEHDKKAK